MIFKKASDYKEVSVLDNGAIFLTEDASKQSSSRITWANLKILIQSALTFDFSTTLATILAKLSNLLPSDIVGFDAQFTTQRQLKIKGNSAIAQFKVVKASGYDTVSNLILADIVSAPSTDIIIGVAITEIASGGIDNIRKSGALVVNGFNTSTASFAAGVYVDSTGSITLTSSDNKLIGSVLTLSTNGCIYLNI